MTLSRPTLADIARLSGVSPATASKVLNRRPDVAESTRARVLAVLQSEGYSRALGPRSRDSAILALFDDLTTQYSALIMSGIVNAAADAAVDVVVRSIQGAGTASGNDFKDLLDVSSPYQGVVAVTAAIPEPVLAEEDLLQRIVTIDPRGRSDPRVLSVSSNNWWGGKSVAEHLIALGHRVIGWIGGPPDSIATAERHQGYRAALQMAGISEHPNLQLTSDYSVHSGSEAATELLRGPERPTAVVCASDSIAVGVIQAATKLGLRVPDDLAVTGYDDIPLAEWVSPSLTTVHVPLAGMGRVAIEALLTSLGGGTAPSHHIDLTTSLVVRGSTTAPAK